MSSQEESDQKNPLEAVDPGDFNQTQRLKEIHKARQAVAEQVRDLDIPESDPGKVYYDSVTKLNHKVALYVFELMPLMQESDVDSEFFELPDEFGPDDVYGYASTMGMDREREMPMDVSKAMYVYSLCNQFMAKIGLGADLDEGLPDDELQL